MERSIELRHDRGAQDACRRPDPARRAPITCPSPAAAISSSSRASSPNGTASAASSACSAANSASRRAIRPPALSALNLIAHLRAALDGDLDRVSRCLRLAGYVNSLPSFMDQSKVMDGASDLFVEIFGEAGRHARLAIGVAVLPYDVAVEVEGVFEIGQG
jgi:enamine deaminase RidA (YjgF/YER057c/UK114 family)